MLVLGSLPGGQSLEQGRYYAHPRNQFWLLLGTAIGADLAALEYDDRLACLIRHRVALWDVVAAGYRQGSLDSSLRIAERADLASLLRHLPDLRAIAFNGALAARHELEPVPQVFTLALPSSSAANTMPIAVKQQRWDELARYLD